MREDKQILVKEVSEHLAKSNYVILTDFQRVTVRDAAALRSSLAKQDAEFHVVKNSILKVAGRECDLPQMNESCLQGPTAIVVGGKNPSEVAKIVKNFQKANDEKAVFKGGILGAQFLSIDDLKALAELPSMDELRAQFLSLLSTPAQQMVRILNAVPQGMLNVLQAKADKA